MYTTKIQDTEKKQESLSVTTDKPVKESDNKKNIVVLSGGTATNSLIDSCFSPALYNKVTFILPISDNGGSSSEIIRLFPGAAPGDFRSRIVKLIDPKCKDDIELARIMNYRLNQDNIDLAKREWNDIIEGDHPLWDECSSILKHMIRSFLINVHIEILKKQQLNPSAKQKFDFRNANIGNFFLTGCRLLIGASFDSGLELMMRICKVDSNKTKVYSCINTNYTHHIAAILSNGQIIIGQSQISHPSSVSVLSNSDEGLNAVSSSQPHQQDTLQQKTHEEDDVITDDEFDVDIKSPDEDDNQKRIHPDLKISQLNFTKSMTHSKLPSPIEKIVYINSYGEIIQPLGNPRCVHSIKHANTLVYSIGSLMTSLLPILILPNVAEAIVCNKKMKKVLLVNSEVDRETEQFVDTLTNPQNITDTSTACSTNTNAFVHMIVKSIYNNLPPKYKPLNLSDNSTTTLQQENEIPISFYKEVLTDVIFLKKGDIPIDGKDLEKKGLNVHCIDSGSQKFEGEDLQEIFKTIGAY
ncbi:hypothetical protein ACO0QE_003930 [Hanseniaspora vineae]